MLPPFVWIRGRLWIIANWNDGMPSDAWLVLRPATTHEEEIYLDRMDDSETEAFYVAVLDDEDRIIGR